MSPSRSNITPLARRMAVVATTLAIAMLMAFAAVRPGAAAADTSGSTFYTTLYTETSTMNPFISDMAGPQAVFTDIYPTLTWLNQTNEPVAYLARSWSVSPDKLTWTFHIQPNLKWSDGQPLTAKDVAWTYNLIMKNSTAGTANGQLLSNFKSVKATDDTTLAITTDTPQANMLSLVATPPIVPEHIWAAHVKNLANYANTATPVVGYGPFTMTGFATNQSVTLTANKSFFMGAPHYDRVILTFYSTSDAAVAALRSGQIDQTSSAAQGLTETEYKALSHVSGIKTYQTESNVWEAIEVNADARTRSGKKMGNGNPLLANATVRRAIALGIDRQVLVDKILGGSGSVGSSYMPPAFPEWKWAPTPSESNQYNPAKANALLDAAGFPKGKDGYRYDKATGKELSFRLGIHNDYSYDAQIAAYMQGWMKAIGIKLKIDAMSTTQLNDNLAVGDWDMLTDSWSTNEDPTLLMSIQTCAVLPTSANGDGGDTDSFFCNKRFDKLYAAEQSEFNAAKRAAEVDEMQKILYDANYDIILYDRNTLAAINSKYAKGFLYGAPDSSGYYPLQNEQIGWVNAVPASASSSSSSSTGPIIAVVVVVLLAAGGGLFFVRRRKTTADERE